ncbi:MAG TPA: PAS domain S-box protein [Anaerovoracaceae bacterium]|nr:PAS domain S-box protein [Anaerovoracaceae bacterium]
MNIKNKYKITILATTSLFVCLITMFIHDNSDFEAVYISLFYIPILMTGLWYYRFTVPLATALAVYCYILDFMDMGRWSINHIYHGFIIIFGSLVVYYLSKKLSRTKQELETSRSILAIEKEHLRITLQSIGDGVISTDCDGNVTMLNEVAKNLTGWLGDTAVGRPFAEIFEIINEYTREKSEDPMKKVLETGQVIELANHTALIAKDGTERSIADSAAPIRDENGNIHCVILVFRDVTERKKAEDALQMKHRQLTDIIDFLPNATLAIDQEKRVIIWNKAIEKMTGIPAAEMIGKGDHAYTIPFYGKARPQLMDLLFLRDEELVTQYPKIIHEGDALIVEVFCPALDNNKGAWIFAKASPLHDKVGNIIGAIESIRDITDRKQVDVALRTSEEKYRFIAENVSDVIWVLNMAKKRMTYVSPSVFQLRGFTPEEAMNQKVDEIFTPESSAIAQNVINNYINIFIKSPEALIYRILELQQNCKNGETVWVEDTGKLRYNSDHEIEFVGVSRNIEERKKAEKQILYISYHDQLTGLYNRRFYEEELKRLDTKRNLPLTIVMGDVDGLKLINDSFGHAMGDELLRKAAEVIKNGCRADDIIARLGGDEFVIILPETDAFETEQIIKRINDLALKEKEGNIDISIAFGYATKSNEEENIQEIFKYAEDLMYQHKRSESSGIRNKTIDLVMNTLYKKSGREQLHSIKVSEICEAIATKMGLSENDVYQIKIAGLMHDIGKIEIDEKILNKPEKLNKDEWERMQRHPEMGYRILSSVNEFSAIADDILEHHERWDGKGYPRGLKGEESSLCARIIAVADSYDAMTTDRTYGKALSEEEATNEIRRCSGTQFDPEVARVFVEKVLGQKWERLNKI